jgi:hypothetical protein
MVLTACEGLKQTPAPCEGRGLLPVWPGRLRVPRRWTGGCFPARCRAPVPWARHAGQRGPGAQGQGRPGFALPPGPMSPRWRPSSRPRPAEQQRGVNGRVPRDPAGSVPRHELLAGLRHDRGGQRPIVRFRRVSSFLPAGHPFTEPAPSYPHARMGRSATANNRLPAGVGGTQRDRGAGKHHEAPSVDAKTESE